MEPKKGDLRIVREWSDKDARYYYSLERYRSIGTYINEANAQYNWVGLGLGLFDRKWAAKQARHYNIELPELAEDEEEE